MSLWLLEFKLKSFHIHTDISQSSLLSLILYFFYNTDLLNIKNRNDFQTLTVSWINNIKFTVSDTLMKANCQILQILHIKTEIWACRHALIFVFTKYKFIHFTNKLNNHNTFTVLTLKAHNIMFLNKCWVLKVILNSQLKFETYV